jgi:hypothetical protein
MLVPIALIVFGSIELIRLLLQISASSERRAVVVQKATDWEIPGAGPAVNRSALPNVPTFDTVTDSPGTRLAYRLPINATAGWISFTMAAACIAWLIGLFAVQIVSPDSDDKFNWQIVFLMAPFVLAGGWTLIVLIRQVFVTIAVGTTRVEISHHPLIPGGTYQGLVSQTGRSHVRWFQVQLVCEEEAIHQQGTDTRRASNRIYNRVLLSERKFDIRPPHAFEATFDIPVPEAAMHSFVAAHNTVRWLLVVRGRMARWGDFERTFPIYVYPQHLPAPVADYRPRPEAVSR